MIPLFDSYKECMEWFRALPEHKLRAMYNSSQMREHRDEIFTVMNEKGMKVD